MSDNYLRLVYVIRSGRSARRPRWRRSAFCVGLCQQPKVSVLEARTMYYSSTPGANMERITCPSCGTDLQDWWGNAMSEAWNSSYENLSVVTSCCQTSTSLNDLVYIWPTAFDRFALVIANPGVASLASGQLKKIGLALGSPLKVIWQRI